MDWVSFEKNILKKIYTGAVQERVKFLHMHIFFLRSVCTCRAYKYKGIIHDC